MPYIVKGAAPSASDATTPIPEGGKLANQVYRNRYFGLTYALPSGWSQKYQGPPPSDSGYYVLAESSSSATSKASSPANLLITAQDLFFSLTPFRNTLEMVRYQAQTLRSEYKLEREPAEVTIANHKFVRMDYVAPAIGLHWYTLSTEIRCHTVDFTFSGRNSQLLEQLVRGMEELKLEESAEQPVCVKSYADGPAVVHKVEPALIQNRFNTIPVRIIVGKDGRVKHVHVISAFPEEAKTITDALLRWKFRPYKQQGRPVDVETGLLFGMAHAAPGVKATD